MIKYIFTDLDGTLLSSDKTISINNIEAIKKVEAKGIKFVVNSGRLPFSFDVYKKELNLDNFVSGNGSLIKWDGKIVYSRPFKSEDSKRIVKLASEYSCFPRAFSIKNIFIYKKDITVMLNIAKKAYGFFDKRFVLNDKQMCRYIDKNDIYKIGFFDKNHDKLESLREAIEKNLDNVNTSFSNYYFLETHDKNTSKGNAIKTICKMFNIDYDEVLVIGDNGNDLSMIDNVFHSACPANASDEIKNKSEYVSNVSCDDDAIADILCKYCDL